MRMDQYNELAGLIYRHSPMSIGISGQLAELLLEEGYRKQSENAILKPFECDSGKVYNFPEKHCAFCKNCTDVFYDYTNGPYLFLCNVGKGDYETCGKFEPEEGAYNEC